MAISSVIRSRFGSSSTVPKTRARKRYGTPSPAFHVAAPATSYLWYWIVAAVDPLGGAPLALACFSLSGRAAPLGPAFAPSSPAASSSSSPSSCSSSSASSPPPSSSAFSPSASPPSAFAESGTSATLLGAALSAGAPSSICSSSSLSTTCALPLRSRLWVCSEVSGSTTTSSSCGELAARPARFVPPSAATGLSFSLAGVSWSFVLPEATEATAVVLLEAAAASPAAGLALKKEVIITRASCYPRVRRAKARSHVRAVYPSWRFSTRTLRINIEDAAGRPPIVQTLDTLNNLPRHKQLSPRLKPGPTMARGGAALLARCLVDLLHAEPWGLGRRQLGRRQQGAPRRQRPPRLRPPPG